jgi:hypothetical protein
MSVALVVRLSRRLCCEEYVALLAGRELVLKYAVKVLAEKEKFPALSRRHRAEYPSAMVR